MLICNTQISLRIALCSETAFLRCSKYLHIGMREYWYERRHSLSLLSDRIIFQLFRKSLWLVLEKYQYFESHNLCTQNRCIKLSTQSNNHSILVSKPYIFIWSARYYEDRLFFEFEFSSCV